MPTSVKPCASAKQKENSSVSSANEFSIYSTEIATAISFLTLYNQRSCCKSDSPVSLQGADAAPCTPYAPAPRRAWRISDGLIAYLAAIILIAQTNCLSRICILPDNLRKLCRVNICIMKMFIRADEHKMQLNNLLCSQRFCNSPFFIAI